MIRLTILFAGLYFTSCSFYELVETGNDKLLFDVLTLIPNAKTYINTPGPNFQTPLMFAVLNDRIDAATYLINSGADMRLGSLNDGYTAVDGACFQGRNEIMQLFIKAANGDMRIFEQIHSDGFAPIHRACWGSETRHSLTIEVLILAGINPLAPSSASTGSLTCLDMTNNQLTRDIIQKQLDDPVVES